MSLCAPEENYKLAESSSSLPFSMRCRYSTKRDCTQRGFYLKHAYSIKHVQLKQLQVQVTRYNDSHEYEVSMRKNYESMYPSTFTHTYTYRKP